MVLFDIDYRWKVYMFLCFMNTVYTVYRYLYNMLIKISILNPLLYSLNSLLVLIHLKIKLNIQFSIIFVKDQKNT